MITEEIEDEQEETQEIEDGTNEYVDDSDSGGTEEEESATNDNVCDRGRTARTLHRTDSYCSWAWTDAVSSQPVGPATGGKGTS